MKIYSIKNLTLIVAVATPLLLGYSAPVNSGVISMDGIMKPADPVNWIGPDNGPILRSVIAQLNPSDFNRVIIQIPPGIFRVDTSVEIDKPYVSIAGSGTGATTLMGNRWRPMFVVQAPGYFELPRQARPRVDNVLDGSVSGWGFATLGKYVAVGVGNATLLGRRDPNHRDSTTYDYYRTFRQITIEIAYRGDLLPGQDLLAIGDGQPFRLYKNGEGSMAFGFLTASPDDPECKTANHDLLWRYAIDQDPNILHKLRIAIDLATGKFEVTDVGKDCKPTMPGASIAGLYLAPSYPGDPFMIGQSGFGVSRGSGATDVSVFGLRICDDFRGEPLSGRDEDRYLNRGYKDEHVVWHLSLTEGTGRWVPIFGGVLADAQTASLTVVDAGTYLQGVPGFSIRDIAIRFASPAVLLGQTLDVTIDRCEFRDGSIGIDMLRTGAAYPIRVNSSVLSGIDCGAAFSETLVYLTDTDVHDFGGCTAIRARGSVTIWTRGHVWYPGPVTQTIVALYRGSYGGLNRLSDIIVDNEDGGAIIRRALVMAEKVGTNPCRLSIDTFYAVYGASNACAIELVGGMSPEPGWLGTAYVDAKGITISGIKTAVKIRNFGWAGKVESYLLPVSNIDANGPHRVQILKYDTTDPVTP